MVSTNTKFSQRFENAASTRVFIGGAGFVLAAFLTGLRILILKADLSGTSVMEGVALIIRGSRQDWAVVLCIVIVAITLSYRRPPARGITKGVVAFLFVSVLLLIWGVANVSAVRMLGEPVTISWIHYSDILNNSVIVEQVLHQFDPALLLIIAAILIAFIVTAILCATLLERGLKTGWRRAFIVLPFILLPMTFGIGGDSLRVNQGKLSNPAIALGVSFLKGGRFTAPFEGLDDGPSTYTELPLEPATPVARPDFTRGQIKNILIIALESTPAKYTDGFGGEYGLTPNLFKYSVMGHTFTNAYAHAPASNYFLVSLLAAVIPELSPHSMTYNYTNLELETISDVLKKRGYRTGFFNSADNRFQNTKAFVSHEGFDTVVDYRDWPCEEGIYESKHNSGKYLNLSNDLCTVGPIIQWIEEDKQSPFLIAVRTGMTHYPYFTGEHPQNYVEDENLNRFLNAINATDEAVGKIMEYLIQSGLLESTLVVLVGDHGEAFGEHGEYLHASAIYEENMHVPLVLINPKLFSGGTSDLVVGISDIAPTVFDLLEIPAPSSWQGLSIFAENRPDSTLFFAPWNGFLVGFREGTKKYIYNGNSEEFMIFDLATDPDEQRNLAAIAPEDVERAKQVLSAWVAINNAWIDRLLRISGEKPVISRISTGPSNLIIHATGTSFKSAPRAEVYIDGAYIGDFEVTSAPVNARHSVSENDIDNAVTTFKFPIAKQDCARRVDVYFMNDEWAGENLTGDTDLYIQSLEFGGRQYLPAEFSLATEGAGGVNRQYFRFWRTGRMWVDLDVESGCLAQSLVSP